MDSPIAGYYSRAHPEIDAFTGEDWEADHEKKSSLNI